MKLQEQTCTRLLSDISMKHVFFKMLLHTRRKILTAEGILEKFHKEIAVVIHETKNLKILKSKRFLSHILFYTVRETEN
jgi:hypothetical protein